MRGAAPGTGDLRGSEREFCGIEVLTKSLGRGLAARAAYIAESRTVGLLVGCRGVWIYIYFLG